MIYSSPPNSVRSLEQRLRNLELSDGLVQRRRVAMALVVVGQLLPEGVIKGGSAMALRYGQATRFTQDLDAARIADLQHFRSDFEEQLRIGWSGFTGRLLEKVAPRPLSIPPAYVMQPFEVKLEYLGRPWCTVSFELGHNELGDAENPEFHLSSHLIELFNQVGLETPRPVAVMRIDFQIAQKLHAVSAWGSERARDLVDLQLLAADSVLVREQTRETCVRLFDYRQQQSWPPVIQQGHQWSSLYVAAADGLDVIPTVEEAVLWANGFIRTLATVES